MNRKNKKLLKLIGIHVLAVAVVIIREYPKVCVNLQTDVR